MPERFERREGGPCPCVRDRTCRVRRVLKVEGSGATSLEAFDHGSDWQNSGGIGMSEKMEWGDIYGAFFRLVRSPGI